MNQINGRHSDSRVGLDTVFHALSHTVRRQVLVALMTDNPRWKDEFETMEFGPVGFEREPISIELHHAHLPPLDEAGFIDWEQTTDRITRGEHFEEIRPLLEVMDDHQDELPDDWP